MKFLTLTLCCLILYMCIASRGNTIKLTRKVNSIDLKIKDITGPPVRSTTQEDYNNGWPYYLKGNKK